MADLMQRGQVWQDGKRNASRTQLVTLRRELEADTIDVPATLGTMPVQSFDGDGNVITTHAQDYIIRVSDYAFGGTVSSPAEHDLIVDSTTGTELIFEVLPVAGDPAARHTNSYGLCWRIHTLQVSDC